MELMRFTCGILWDVMGFSEIVMVICGNLANNNCGINRDLSISVRYGWAFRTRVLKTRVPERAFWVNPFFQWYKVNLSPGFEQRNLSPPTKKGFQELLWAQTGGWSHQKVDLPNSGSFFGWSKKGSGLTRFVGKLGFLPGSFFSLKEKVLTSHKFYRSAINRGPRRKNIEKLYVTQRILFARSKKRIGRLLEPKTTITPPCVRNARSGTYVLRSAFWPC